MKTGSEPVQVCQSQSALGGASDHPGPAQILSTFQMISELVHIISDRIFIFLAFIPAELRSSGMY